MTSSLHARAPRNTQRPRTRSRAAARGLGGGVKDKVGLGVEVGLESRGRRGRGREREGGGVEVGGLERGAERPVALEAVGRAEGPQPADHLRVVHLPAPRLLVVHAGPRDVAPVCGHRWTQRLVSGWVGGLVGEWVGWLVGGWVA